ncbi:MAG: hypothetical protein OXE86_09505 [Alphaproteobacteria bacterium]|nr:hypothetical protein [Alphaproteobacteria bacterium]
MASTAPGQQSSARVFAALVAALACLALAGCGDRIADRIAAGFEQADEALERHRVRPPTGPDSDRPWQVLRDESRPYLGLAPIRTEAARLPPELDAEILIPRSAFPPGHTAVRDAFAASTGLQVRLAGEPVRIVTSLTAPDIAPEDGVGFLAFVNPDVEPLPWVGSASAFLDAWTGEAGYTWSWDGERVTVHRRISKVWTVNALAGPQQWSLAVSSSASGGGGGVSGGNEQSVAAEYVDDPFEEVRQSLHVAGEGKVILDISPSTGRVRAIGPPGAVAQVESALHELNRTTLRPLALTFSMYRITHRNRRTFELGIAGILRDVGNGFADIDVEIGGDTGLVIGTPAAGSTEDDVFGAVLKALRDVGSVRRLLSVDVPSLNGRPAQFYDLRDRVYLSEVSVTSQDDSGNTETSLQTATVSEGILISYRAQIIAHDEMLARIAINLLDPAEIRNFAVQDLTIQQPEQARRAIVSSQSIRTGEILVLTGFSDHLQAGEDRVGAGLLGESRWDADRRMTEQIMLVTARIGRPLGIVEESPGIAPMADASR